jgi:hypothetical protein
MARRIFFLLLSFSLTSIAAWANPDEENYTRLARLSYMEGHVSYQHIADVEWSVASVNLPLEPGDRIYTGPDGRAEIEFDDGSVYRLARNTDIEILSLKEELIQLRILVGLSTLMISSDADFEINTPAAAFNPLRRGVYRFDVGEDGDSEAVVRTGKLEAANNHFSRRIESGEMLHITSEEIGNPDFSRYERRDEWDEWNDRRNADMNAYAGTEYLPDNVYMGVPELQRYGRWVQVDTYGSAWIPDYADVSWSPYSVGRWCYRPLFGWTWVSYEPWGWLPYHYGRWYRSSIYGWCWLPGPAFAFDFWSPGLVTFYSGPGWISWCPLGPGDYYDINNYHYNRGIYSYQLDQLRRLHTRAPGDLFHRNDRGAFRTVPTDRFRNGSIGNRGRSTEWENVDQPWRQGNLIKDRLPVQPTPASFRAVPDREAARPSRAARSLPSIVRTSPGSNLRGQTQFIRITNPQIPSLPSRSARKQNEQRDANAGSGSRSNVRVIEAPQNERNNPSSQNPVGNSSGEQGGSRTTTYGRSGVSRSSRESSGAGVNSVPATRPDNNPPATQRNAPVWRYDGRPSQQEQTQQAPSEVTPRGEDRQLSNRVGPRSNVEERSNAEGSVIMRTPKANTAPTNNSPRPSNPSAERNNGARSVSGTSNVQSGGDKGSSAGRSGSEGNSKRDSGGSQKASERGASSDGGNRR